MRFLIPLASLLGIEVSTLAANLRRRAIAYVLLGVLGFVCVCFLIIAGYIALSDVTGPVIAALIFAGGALVLALLISLILWIGDSRRRRIEAEKKRSSETLTLLTTVALTAAPVLLRSKFLRTASIPAAALIALALLDRRGDDNDGSA